MEFEAIRDQSTTLKKSRQRGAALVDINTLSLEELYEKYEYEVGFFWSFQICRSEISKARHVW
jgi:hypothetical protein